MKPLSGSPAEAVREERPSAPPESWRLPSGASLTEFTLRSGFLASAIVRLGAEPKPGKPAAARQRIRVARTRPTAPPVPEP